MKELMKILNELKELNFSQNPWGKIHFRICPNPDCRKIHFPKHRGRDFCSDKCNDDFNNRKKQLKRQALNEQNRVEEKQETEEVSSKPKDDSIQTGGNPWLDRYDNNLRILNSLDLNFENGSTFRLLDFVRCGFDFSCNSGQGLIHNVDSRYGCRFLQFDNFRIFLVDLNLILIKKF